MVNIKLEELIKNALKGKYWGNNKVVVETDSSGNIEIYEYDEESSQSKISELEEEIEELKEEIEELKEENGELEEQVNMLQDKIEENEGW